MAADPFASAGFAPAQGAPAVADPFSGAGFAAPPQQPPAPPPQPTNLGTNLPGQLPVFGNPALNQAFVEGAPRAGEKVAEGATFGMFPYIAAAGRWLTGTPWDQALQQSRDYTAETTRQDPGTSAILEGAGSLMPTGAALHAAAPLLKAAEAIPYAGSPLAQALLGGGLGAASAAGHDIGSGQTQNLGSDTARGGIAGGIIGGVAPVIGQAIQAVPNVARGGAVAMRNVFSGSGRDAVAGQILREAGGDFANDAATAPIPGLQLRTVQATGNPGLAGLENTIVSEPSGKAVLPGQLVNNGRTPDQMSALAKSLVGTRAGEEPAILTNETAANGTQAIQGAHSVLKQAETDLWNAPELRGVKLNSQPLIAGVQSDVAHMPASYRLAMGQGPLAGFMADIGDIQNGASIQDVNAIRSRVLEQARASRAAGDNVTGAAAESLAGSLLGRTEGALGNAGEAVRDAYATARDFTRQRAQAFGYPEFDAILRPNAAGNIRANPETAFGKFFDLNGGTSAGLQRLQNVSNLLRTTGQPEALTQADTLDQAAQDYMRAGMLRQARAGNGLDATNAPVTNPATLASTINRQLPVINGTPMLSPMAGDLDATSRAASLLNRPSTLRGDSNSTTYEKLRNRDLVSAVLGQAGTSSLGAAAGGYGAYEYGPESVPWYLRVPGGMLAGALMGQTMGPYVGKAVSGFPFVKDAVAAPTRDIVGRVGAALADPAEYQRLIATRLSNGPTLLAPGIVSNAVPQIANAAVPMITRGGAQ